LSDDKIKILEEKNIHLWFDDSPIALCASMLALDIDKAELFASVKFMNLQTTNIRSLTFDICCYDAQRNQVECIPDITYNSLDVARNIEFGYKRRVPVQNPQTRSVEFILKQTTDISGNLWKNSWGLPFNTSLEQQSIFTFQGNLNRQFIDICTRSHIDGTVFSFQPEFEEKYWLCGCGCFNWNIEQECFNCGVGKSWLKRNSSLEILEKQSDFVEQQKIEIQEKHSEFKQYSQNQEDELAEFANRKKEYQKQLQKQKFQKTFGSVGLVILILAVVAAAAYGIFFYVIPRFQNTSASSDFGIYHEQGDRDTYDDFLEYSQA